MKYIKDIIFIVKRSAGHHCYAARAKYYVSLER